MQLAKDRRNPGIREQNVPDRNSPPPGLPAPTPQERQIQSASRHFESVALGSRALAASHLLPKQVGKPAAAQTTLLGYLLHPGHFGSTRKLLKGILHDSI